MRAVKDGASTRPYGYGRWGRRAYAFGVDPAAALMEGRFEQSRMVEGDFVIPCIRTR